MAFVCKLTMDPEELEKAGEQGDVRLLQMLLQHDPNLLHQVLASTSMAADSPLHTAAMRGHHEFVKEVLTHVPDLARQRNKRGSYPLHLAAANGHGQVVEELLTMVGSDLCQLQDKDGRMAIHVAAMKGRIDVLDKLVAADPNSLEELVTTKGETVLHLSVRAHQISVVKFLAEQPSFDAVLLNHKDVHGSTSLHLAAAGKNLEVHLISVILIY